MIKVTFADKNEWVFVESDGQWSIYINALIEFFVTSEELKKIKVGEEPPYLAASKLNWMGQLSGGYRLTYPEKVVSITST